MEEWEEGLPTKNQSLEGEEEELGGLEWVQAWGGQEGEEQGWAGQA